MLEDIRFHKEQVALGYAARRVFVLPAPYGRGHIRFESGLCPGALPQIDGYRLAQSERSVFLTFDDGLLSRAAQAMCLGGEEGISPPGRGALHTILFQIRQKQAAGHTMNDDLRFLIRAAMDVPQIVQAGDRRRAVALLGLSQAHFRRALARHLSLEYIYAVPIELMGPAKAFEGLLLFLDEG